METEKIIAAAEATKFEAVKLALPSLSPFSQSLFSSQSHQPPHHNAPLNSAASPIPALHIPIPELARSHKAQKREEHVGLTCTKCGNSFAQKPAIYARHLLRCTGMCSPSQGTPTSSHGTPTPFHGTPTISTPSPYPLCCYSLSSNAKWNSCVKVQGI